MPILFAEVAPPNLIKQCAFKFPLLRWLDAFFQYSCPRFLVSKLLIHLLTLNGDYFQNQRASMARPYHLWLWSCDLDFRRVAVETD